MYETIYYFWKSYIFEIQFPLAADVLKYLNTKNIFSVRSVFVASFLE